jgi:hypothetical protein
MTENDDDVKKSIFNSMSRNTQVIFVGLLAGALLIGIYLVGMGILSTTEKPTILSSGKLRLSTYPLSFQHNYYEKRSSEYEIYNDAEWDVDRVWIGSGAEYSAYRNGSMVMGNHMFKGPFKTERSFDYKIPLMKGKTIFPKQDIVVEINGGGNGKVKTCSLDENGCRVMVFTIEAV